VFDLPSKNRTSPARFPWHQNVDQELPAVCCGRPYRKFWLIEWLIGDCKTSVFSKNAQSKISQLSMAWKSVHWSTKLGQVWRRRPSWHFRPARQFLKQFASGLEAKTHHVTQVWCSHMWWLNEQQRFGQTVTSSVHGGQKTIVESRRLLRTAWTADTNEHHNCNIYRSWK